MKYTVTFFSEVEVDIEANSKEELGEEICKLESSELHNLSVGSIYFIEEVGVVDENNNAVYLYDEE